MEPPITGLHRDDHGHWVAGLACGHCQHLRHDPPGINRPWTRSAARRAAAVGRTPGCRACDRAVAPDTG